jgi:acyl carrier protein
MPKFNESFVAEAVYSVLERLGVSPVAARETDVPLLNLLLDEDATFEFVPEIEEVLDVRVPPEDWERVQTVTEVIVMLQEHVKA